MGGIGTLSPTAPMNPAVLVPAPAIVLTDDGTSSTYTPGDRYCGIFPLTPIHHESVSSAAQGAGPSVAFTPSIVFSSPPYVRLARLKSTLAETPPPDTTTTW